jgi:pyridoxal phosphate enzyme (YggS family)
MQILENLKRVKEKIANAARKSNRNENDIVIVAVTKNIPIQKIEEGINAGITIIGENRVQEAKLKYNILGNKVKWHMVGHLQRNKVKDAIKIFELIHSIDRIELVDEIEKEAQKQNIIVHGLVQVNISKEETKYGVEFEETEEFINKIAKYKNIKIFGLMGIGPLTENKERIRECFRNLNNLFQKLKKYSYPNIEMKWLSMGMSNDFEIAIEEGSNMVRIGTAIFGPRE